MLFCKFLVTICSTFQVSGIKFAFDPKKPPGQRVDRELVRVGDEYVNKDGVYHLVSKHYSWKSGLLGQGP